MSSASFGSTHPRSTSISNGANPFAGYVKIGVVGRGAYGICCAYKKFRDAAGPPRKVIIKSVPLEGLSREAKEKVLGESENARAFFIYLFAMFAPTFFRSSEEARILQGLRHPNIINCYGHHIYENNLHIIMHYAEGGTLQDLIADQRGKYLPGN